ncbi:MAG: hypothetical protein A3D92_22605 [Bacteroidetes bacterium RIFCSPHIGHO2_02_FULL_44_7]|nr:MAG: hypothetical protein A3D92_22605 [Bacteroidetes bacterium RIFCSPHIGHO2_02_FULL_44_7]
MERDNYQFLGLHFMWWSILGILFLVIFVVPRFFPRQRSKEVTALDRLKKQFTSGQISKTAFRRRKKDLEE